MKTDINEFMIIIYNNVKPMGKIRSTITMTRFHKYNMNSPDLCTVNALYKSFASRVFLRPFKNIGNVYLKKLEIREEQIIIYVIIISKNITKD